MKAAVLALALASTCLGQSETTNSSSMSLSAVLAANPQLSSLTDLIQPFAQQFSSLSNITLLAPNNDAISEFLNTSAGATLGTQPNLVQAILNYHVLQGNYSNITNTSFVPTELRMGAYANVTGGQRVMALPGSNITFFSGLLQNSSVVNASIPFESGTIHVIDRLLTIPQNISATGVALNLTSAVGALQNTSLVQTVDNTPDLTVFVPSNAAFQRIGGNLANLSTSQLADILQYHVVAGQVLYSTNITMMNGSSIGTLNQGTNLTLSVEGSDVYVNNARVITPNVLVRNGVVHVIDRVLNPANSTATPNTADTSATEQAFPSASSASDEPFTSGIATPTSSIATDSVASAQASATSTDGAWRPMETGALGMVALFGGAAAVMNL